MTAALPPPNVLAHAITAVSCLAPQRPKVLLIADMNMADKTARLWVLDYDKAGLPVLMRTQVASGSGSDPKGLGRPTRFSNTPDSLETSLGLYMVGDKFKTRTWRYQLVGLSPSDSNAADRAILLHPAPYVSPDHVGNSEGCAAISMAAFQRLESIISPGDAYLWIDGPGVPVPSPTCG